MATQPAPAPKPAQPHQQSTQHKPAEDPHPAKKEPYAPPKARVEPLPIGAKPDDPKDPQAAKFEAHAGPPTWTDPKHGELEPPPIFTPEPSLDPRAQKAPVGAWVDGMDIATEQRARAAWVEAHGRDEYAEAVDQRPEAERPTYDPHALAGGGAFVSAGKQSKVPGVTPPTKRE